MPDLLVKFVLSVLWISVRTLVVAGYTSAFVVFSVIALPELGFASKLATVYLPALLATLLGAAGVHYLFGPEFRREVAKEHARRPAHRT